MYLNDSIRITLTVNQLRKLISECRREQRSLLESKDKLIDKLPHLDVSQKEEMKKFFAKHPNFEKNFDWNKPGSITYDSFIELANDHLSPINPDDIPEFHDKRNEGHGIVSYEVDDTKGGQLAVRKIVDTHWGKDANPWCLITRTGTGLDGYAWDKWMQYSILPKRIAFKNGKLIAFMGTEGETSDIDSLTELREKYGEEFENSDDGEGEMSFTDWMAIHYRNELSKIAKPEWWDRRNKSHPNLNFA